MTDMTNQAIKWSKRPEVADAGQAVLHSTSRQVPRTPRTTRRKEWIAKYKGKFDQGWDKLREETLARQKRSAWFRRTPSSPPSRRRSRTGIV